MLRARSSLSAGWRLMLAVVLVAAVGAIRVASQTPAPAPESFVPPDWDAGVKLPEVEDTNPDPNIVEINLTARVADVSVSPDEHVKAWTYNGGLPGPLIKTKVGDRLIVHLKNELDEGTTIHWHGIRVPIEMDGVPEVSQPEVKPGESFTYDFVVPDAGLFWYHPHFRSEAQVGYGLYGALLVEDPAEAKTVPIADQVTLVLSDIGFGRDGTLEPADSGGPAGDVFGREGAYVLVNGRIQPTIKARSGAPQRWRIVNAAKSRFFYLDLEGQPFTVIGTDGGLQEYPTKSDLLLVTAGERVDVLVTPTGAPGSEIVLRSMLYNRGYGSVEYRGVEQLLNIAFTDAPALPPQPLPKVTREITPYDAKGATPVEVVFTLPPAFPDGHSEFHVNGVPYWKAPPDAYTAKLGETQLWTIKNDSDWDHPHHQHGFFFMVTDENGVPKHPLAWKDTLNIPMKETVHVLVKFDERPGNWMFHCHILDHAEIGLMGFVRVGDAPTMNMKHMHLKLPR